MKQKQLKLFLFNVKKIFHTIQLNKINKKKHMINTTSSSGMHSSIKFYKNRTSIKLELCIIFFFNNNFKKDNWPILCLKKTTILF